jgi:predicted small lipoprotein YifL
VTRPPRRAPPPLLGALLALGGCGLFRGPPSPPPPDQDTPAHRACREEARNSEAVRDLERQRNPQNFSNWDRLAEEARVRENRAYRDCLRREGLALPGGVEAPRPR